uniref:Uncharacterized protein n=1 Tax=Mycena chlorophos TaxID=658473 RepID=A0ABQ0KZ16_MYCCL|nr:predicted protein [Mycena chlorophos]
MSDASKRTGNLVKSTDASALQAAIETMDSLSQCGFGQIEAICGLALSALENPETATDIDRIGTALEAIQNIADDIKNSVNCQAEDVGCHWINVPWRRRADARRQQNSEGQS